MEKILVFKGDFRQEIANHVSGQYEGLLHMVALEFFKKENLTLLYSFKREIFGGMSNVEKIFGQNFDWVKENSIDLDIDKNHFTDIAKNEYYLYVSNNSSGCEEYRIINHKQDNCTKIFEKLESILEFRKIERSFVVKDHTGKDIKKFRVFKKFSIRIDSGNSSSPLDFDSLDELRDVLSNTCHAKKLIPVAYTPWDTTDSFEEKACEIQNLSLQYLYENQNFRVARF